jgi:phospholipase/carboxylesterase
MTNLLALDGPRVGPFAGGAPDSLVVFLHGLGADGNDLIGLAPYWQERLATAAFVSPNAPFPCDMAQDRTPSRILAGVQASAPILDAFLDEELARWNLPPERMALVGFSQGTMMSLFVAPRRAAPLAGVIGFSGALVGGDRLAEEIRSRPPVLLVHGDADAIVPVGASRLAEQQLSAAGIAVRFVQRPGLPHSIDEVGLSEGGAFLARVFGAETGQR